ncbi:TIGR03943 family protein, partial [Streptomyces sp. uw30]
DRGPGNRRRSRRARRARVADRGRRVRRALCAGPARRAAQGVGHFPALPAGNPVQLTLAEFSSRAIYDSGRSLSGRTVRLTGFVTRDDDGTWYVTRLLVACCAADATTSKVEIRGGQAPPVDAWVTVTGTWRPKGRLGTDAAWPPVLDAGSVRRIAEPADPYEKR